MLLCRFNEDESFFREIFEKYITELKEKAREKERRRREEKVLKSFIMFCIYFSSTKLFNIFYMH